MALVLENGIWKLQADSSGDTPVTLSMGNGGSHSYGTLADGDTLSGGIWDGWKVQIDDAVTDPLALSDVSAGLQIESTSPTGTGGITAAATVTEMHGIYLDVKGDFSFGCVFAGGGTGDTYAIFGAGFWNIADITRMGYSGAGNPYTAAQFRAYAGITANGNNLGRSGGTTPTSFSSDIAFKIVRSGGSITYFYGSDLSSLTQYYPASTNVKYDAVGNYCRVGIYLGGNVTATRTISSAELTYIAAT